MRFLLDGNLPPRPVERPTGAGYDARHVTDLGLAAADDSAIFDRAAADGDVVVNADSDFSMRLAARRSAQPSVILLRHVAELPSTAHGDLLIANLPQIIDDLDPPGAVVSLGPTRLAVRRLQVSACPFDRDPDGGERGVVFLIGFRTFLARVFLVRRGHRAALIPGVSDRATSSIDEGGQAGLAVAVHVVSAAGEALGDAEHPAVQVSDDLHVHPIPTMRAGEQIRCGAAS